jgi:hypothetical protein
MATRNRASDNMPTTNSAVSSFLSS